MELNDYPGRKRYVNRERLRLGRPHLQYPSLTAAQEKIQEEYDATKPANGGGRGRGQPATNLHSNPTAEPEEEETAADTPWMADFRELAEQLGLEGPVLQRSHVLPPAGGALADDAMRESEAALLRGWPELRMQPHLPTSTTTTTQPPSFSLHAMSMDAPESAGNPQQAPR